MTAIALDDDNVFVAEGNGAVLKIPKAGGGPIRLKASGGQRDIWTVNIAVDGTHVYWDGDKWDGGASIVGATVMRVAKTGGPAERIGYKPGGAVKGQALGPTDVYYLESGSDVEVPETVHVRRIPKSGGAGEVFSLPQRRAEGLSADGEALFLAVYDPKRDVDGALQLVRLDPRTSKFSELGPGGGWAMAVDATHIYWARGLSVFRMNKQGGVAEELFESPSRGAIAMDLVVDETMIYWTAYQRGKESDPYVMKVKKTGGVAVSLAERSLGGYAHLAVDARDLYVMTPSSVLVHPK